MADQAFAPLNVMILVRKPNVPDRPREAIGRRLFGNPDDAFLQSKPKRGLLTPAEIRAMALAEMDLGPASIVWDIGAGSGSVAVEAAQIARDGRVYAIEMDVEDHRLIIENAKRFGVGNLVPVLGHAPEAWQDLPDARRGFHRRQRAGHQPAGRRRLRAAAPRRPAGGHHAAASTTWPRRTSTLHARCPDVKVWMLSLARGNCQMERLRFEAMNPVFLVAVVKK